jgi:hypothetical protein
MLVGRAPAGLRPTQACNFSGGVTVLRDGRHVAPASFLKLDQEGSPVFGGRCPGFLDPSDPPSPVNSVLLCRMRGFFGVWPIELSLRSDRTPEWAVTYERVIDFLRRYVVDG